MSKIDYKLSLETSYNLKKAPPIYLHSNNNFNEVEEASLILGLYIFGKDFVRVKRFIGTKSIGELKTFYYTKFYQSEDHKRWRIYKEARETIRGSNMQQLFIEPTHQHFLSHLLHNESAKHCCNKLLEVVKNFHRGNLKLEEYVFALKDLVGVEALIDAVGIGKENDLTSPTANSMKSINEILAGKDYSNLTHIEIILLLTCNARVSKTRESGLFWRAVWPRLLAKGWSKISKGCSIVFGVPGVEGVSRKLVKGIHYFDSIKDLLAEVASHPELIKDPVKETAMVNQVFGMKFDDPDVVRVSALEDHFRNHVVETVRKSKRNTKPSMKALEAVVDKMEEVTSSKRMRR
ncbi:hypothetical protein KIW84_014259 [Lathyrus oleraceus]|uniref:SANT domain-containing protein n=2 Tax=Pisum sativum TaxID=3888 RepID=A0A9D5BMH9_PEA|nr:hypothetical protein KIW84_014259 [Pisum sativum]